MHAHTDGPSDRSVGGEGRGRPPSDAELTSASLWLRVAGGKLALQYLERAGDWAADIDPYIVSELEEIRLQLLRRLEELSASQTAPDEDAEGY